MEVACVLIPDSTLADPVEAGELTERALRRLERIGADALLEALPLGTALRFPERRVVLTPGADR